MVNILEYDFFLFLKFIYIRQISAHWTDMKYSKRGDAESCIINIRNG